MALESCTSIQYDVRMMDGVELELTCLCGYENFERVIVQRLPNPPLFTDFVACVGCRAMYYAPVPKADPPPASGPGDRMSAIGGPEAKPDSQEALKRDAADAAKDYVKPGRMARR
jgi:hypothetical protein